MDRDPADSVDFPGLRFAHIRYVEGVLIMFSEAKELYDVDLGDDWTIEATIWPDHTGVITLRHGGYPIRGSGFRGEDEAAELLADFIHAPKSC